jgi:hypothetical protein
VTPNPSAKPEAHGECWCGHVRATHYMGLRCMGSTGIERCECGAFEPESAPTPKETP